MDSRIALERLSEDEGNTKTSNEARTAGMSRRSPKKKTRSFRPRFRLRVRAPDAAARLLQQKFQVVKSVTKPRGCTEKHVVVFGLSCSFAQSCQLGECHGRWGTAAEFPRKTPILADHCRSRRREIASNHAQRAGRQQPVNCIPTASHQPNIAACARDFERLRRSPS